MRQIGLVLAALVLMFQVIKGLNLETSLYPLVSYIFTYEDGPLRRGLLPTIFASLGITDLADIGRNLARLHVLLIMVLAGVLLGRLAQLKYAGDAPRRWLLWLLLASAVLPVLAATTGYVDVLLALGLIAIAALLAQGYALSAAALLLALALQHEMVLVPGLCLFAAEALLQPENRRRALAAGAGVFVVSGLLLALASHVQPGLVPLAEARCADLRPAAHAMVSEIWDKYCVRQVSATLASDFTPERLLVLPFFLMVYGAYALVLLAFGFVQARRHSSVLVALALLALMAAPAALVTIAWDTDRFIILASISGWLILDRWLQVQPPAGISRKAALVVAVLVVAQLLLAYPATGIYGQKQLVPPNVERHYLIDARGLVLPVLAHYDLAVPALLKSETCSNLRCQR